MNPRRTDSSILRPRSRHATLHGLTLLLLGLLPLLVTQAPVALAAGPPIAVPAPGVEPRPQDPIRDFTQLLIGEVPDPERISEFVEQLPAAGAKGQWSDESMAAWTRAAEEVAQALASRMHALRAASRDPNREAQKASRELEELADRIELLGEAFLEKGPPEALYLLISSLGQGVPPWQDAAEPDPVLLPLARFEGHDPSPQQVAEALDQIADALRRQAADDRLRSDLSGEIDRRIAAAIGPLKPPLPWHVLLPLLVLTSVAISLLLGMALRIFRPARPLGDGSSPGLQKLEERVESLATRLGGELNSAREHLERIGTLPLTDPKSTYLDALSRRCLDLEDALEDLQKSLRPGQDETPELKALPDQIAQFGKNLKELQGNVISSFREAHQNQMRLAAQLNQVELAMPGFSERLQAIEARTTPDLLSHETDALRGQWNLARRWDGLDDFLALAERSSWKERFSAIRQTLPSALAPNETLRESLEITARPVAQVAHLHSKLIATGRLLESTSSASDASSRERSPEQELATRRDFASHLFLYQATEEGRRIRSFRLEDWVREKFRSFADQFFREYWLRQLEGRHRELEEARRLVDEILSWGDLEVVDVEPGRTLFDSRLHIGRSTSSNPNYPDGVVMTVVKVGFKDRKTGGLLQTPEVVVNRR